MKRTEKEQKADTTSQPQQQSPAPAPDGKQKRTYKKSAPRERANRVLKSMQKKIGSLGNFISKWDPQFPGLMEAGKTALSEVEKILTALPADFQPPAGSGKGTRGPRPVLTFAIDEQAKIKAQWLPIYAGAMESPPESPVVTIKAEVYDTKKNLLGYRAIFSDGTKAVVQRAHLEKLVN